MAKIFLTLVFSSMKPTITGFTIQLVESWNSALETFRGIRPWGIINDILLAFH